MPLRIVFVLPLILLGHLLFGQKPGAELHDSLRLVAKSLPKGSEKVLRLNDMCAEFQNSAPDLAIEFGEEALAIADSLGDGKLKAAALDRIAGVFWVFGDYEKQAAYHLQALDIRQKLKDHQGIAESLNNLGNVHYIQGNNDEALDYYHRSLSEMESMHDKRGIAGGLNNIGIVYHRKHDWNSALLNYRMALKINLEIENEESAAKNMRNIGLIELELQHFDSALHWQNRSLQLRREIDDQAGVAGSLNSIAEVHDSAGDFRKALQFYQAGLEVAKTIKGPKWRLEAYAGLAHVYRQTGRYAEALAYSEKYHALQDSLFSQKSAASIAKAESKVEYSKKARERELETKAAEAASKVEIAGERMTRNIVIVVAVFILMLAGILYNQYRQKQKANLLLEDRVNDRTRALRKANEELNTFIYRASHDLRSPLTSMRGLLDIARREEDPEKSATFLDMVSDRLDHEDHILTNLINTIHIREKHLERAEFPVKEFGEHIQEEWAKSKLHGFVKVKIKSNGNQYFKTDRDVLSAILLQLISNSAIFRDKGKEVATCTIQFDRKGNSQIIKVLDNGIGMPEKTAKMALNMFFRGTHESKGSGLGLYLVKTGLERLRGKIQIESTEGTGTLIRLEIPS